jgi:hypothetical protein
VLPLLPSGSGFYGIGGSLTVLAETGSYRCGSTRSTASSKNATKPRQSDSTGGPIRAKTSQKSRVPIVGFNPPGACLQVLSQPVRTQTSRHRYPPLTAVNRGKKPRRSVLDHRGMQYSTARGLLDCPHGLRCAKRRRGPIWVQIKIVALRHINICLFC